MTRSTQKPLKKSLVLVLKYAVGGLLGLTLLWVTLGNALATAMKRDADAQLETFIEDSLAQRTQYNDSALTLAALGADLGVTLLGGTDSEADRQLAASLEPRLSAGSKAEFEGIQDSLGDYLDRQIKTPDNSLEPIPEDLQRYLTSHGAAIAAVRDHLATQPPPTWELPANAITSLRSGTSYTVALPARLGQVDLNRVLLLQVIAAIEAGDLEAVTQGITASSTLANSLEGGLTLIDQLVLVINGRLTDGVLRKTNGIPATILEPWLERDSTAALLRSIELEFFGTYSTIKLLKTGDLEIFEVLGQSPAPSTPHIAYGSLNSQFLGLFNPFVRPYFIFSALDTFQISMDAVQQWQADPPNLCDPNFNGFQVNPAGSAAPWNIFGQIAIPSFLNQPLKAQQHRLELELTQQVLTAKGLAATTGQWPSQLPQPQSQVCPGTSWTYTATPQGSMTLSLSSLSPWLQERLTPSEDGTVGVLPLTFSMDQPPPRTTP